MGTTDSGLQEHIVARAKEYYEHALSVTDSSNLAPHLLLLAESLNVTPFIYCETNFKDSIGRCLALCELDHNDSVLFSDAISDELTAIENNCQRLKDEFR